MGCESTGIVVSGPSKSPYHNGAPKMARCIRMTKKPGAEASFIFVIKVPGQVGEPSVIQQVFPKTGGVIL